jgi:hypothetical protein
LKYGDGAWPYYEDENTGEIWEENGAGGYDDYHQYGEGLDDEGNHVFVAQVEAQAYSELGPWLQVDPTDLVLTLVADADKNLRPAKHEYPKDLVEFHVDYKSLLFGIRPSAILPEKEPPAKSPGEKEKEKEKEKIGLGSPTVSFKPASPDAGSGTSAILAQLIEASPTKGSESPMKRFSGPPIPLSRRFSDVAEERQSASPATASASAEPAAGRKSARKEARVAVAEEKRDKRASTKRTRTSGESDDERAEKVAKASKTRKPGKEAKTRRSGSPVDLVDHAAGKRAHASRPARDPKDPAVTGARNALAAVTKPGKKTAPAFTPSARNALAPRPVIVDPLDDDEDEPREPPDRPRPRNPLTSDTGLGIMDASSGGVARNALTKSRVDSGLREGRVTRPRETREPSSFERERLSPEPARGRRERSKVTDVIELNNTPEKPLSAHRGNGAREASAATGPFGGIFGRAAGAVGIQRDTAGGDRVRERERDRAPPEREREPLRNRDIDEEPPPPRAAPTASAMPRPGGAGGAAQRREPGSRAGGFALRMLGGGGLLGNNNRRG